MHRKRLEQIYAELASRPEGLTSEEALTNLEKFGHNIIRTKAKKHWLVQLFEEIFDLMVIILIIAGVISYIFGKTTDATVIFCIVILNIIVSFVQKYRAEKAVEALQRMISPHARVLRDGKQVEIDSFLLVPGDIIILTEGTLVPADARLIEANQLECDQSILTGESEPAGKEVVALKGKYLPKIEQKNIVFMGTIITHGEGKAIVFATGDKTEFGKITHLTATTKQDQSPLQKELKLIGLFVAFITLIISVTLFVIGFFLQGKPFVDNLIFTISVAVAAVPEGLPATITIALALGVQRLAGKKAIIKQLSSVETLGCTTVILSDKTGTLTTNEMTVKELYFNNTYAEVKGVGYTPKGEIQIMKQDSESILIGRDDHVIVDMDQREKDLKVLKQKEPFLYEPLRLMALIGTLCSTAKLSQLSENKYSLIGNPTEGAALTLIRKAGFSFKEFENTYKYLEKIPFDSERKRMSVVVKNLHTHEIFVLSKGATSSILDKCTGILINGKRVDLTKEARTKLEEKTNEMAKNALRVLAFAYKEMPRKEKDKYTEAATENNLTFVGLMGMLDPPRREVKEAIALTKEAGIKTYIVTGDNGFTASAIAKQIGLITSDNFEIVTGEDLNKMSDHKLKKLLADKEKEIIFARVSPQHKLKLTNILKELNEIVAVTGDGVNDAPALKRADIGIAMGIKGTDVSKEASSMVLTDDSFNSIVRAIEEGRTIYQNMKKFIFYIFSCNIGELIVVFVAILANLPTPITAVLILAVNVGTDILPALALGIEPTEKDIMNRPPRDQKRHIINKGFISRFAYIGALISIVVLGIFIWNLYRFGWTFGETIDTASTAYLKSTTMAFAALVTTQLFNAYNARSENSSITKLGFLRNPYIFGSILISLGIVFAITEIPLLQNYLKVTSLSAAEWGIIFISSSSILIIEEIRKFFFKTPKF
jgi:potassium/sodium efflux P-type ATPase